MTSVRGVRVVLRASNSGAAGGISLRSYALSPTANSCTLPPSDKKAAVCLSNRWRSSFFVGGFFKRDPPRPHYKGGGDE